MEKRTQTKTIWTTKGTESFLIELDKFEQEDGMPREEKPTILGGVELVNGFYCCWAFNSFQVRVELTAAFKPEVAQRHVEQYLINIKQLSYYENHTQKAA
jgi:hypothetical protein